VTASRTLSVVVPVHQGGANLARVLAALEGNELPRASWELIVVVDASTDDSAEIAAGHADLVIRLTGAPRGPAYARNRGFDAARGSLVAFVDADVLVHSDALPRMIEAIESDPSIGAVMGTYDAGRTSRSLVSEYRNLLRHFEHHANAGETDAFWAGLAVVRREAFVAAGMFDEWRFKRPQAEALELGDRIRSLGYRILRRLDVQATHLKQWTLGAWIRADIVDRGITLARLNQFAALRGRVDRLYLATSLGAVLACVTLASTLAAVWQPSAFFALVALGCLGALVIHNAGLIAALARARGIAFAIAVIPLHVITCAIYGIASAAGRTLYHAVGEPQPDPVMQAYAEVGVRTWPPVPTPLAQSAAGRTRSASKGPGAPRAPRVPS
jgi:GT2 family glycosyltransferase